MKMLKAKYASITNRKILTLTKTCKAWISKQKNANATIRKLILLEILREKIPSKEEATVYTDKQNQTEDVSPVSICGGCFKECRNGFGLGDLFACPSCLKTLFVFQKELKVFEVQEATREQIEPILKMIKGKNPETLKLL